MNDLIDRQAAIDLFPNDALEWDTNGGYIAPHFARQMIEELPSTQQWIPCSERLPNHDEYIKNNGLFNVSDGDRSYSEWFDIYNKQMFGEHTISGFRIDYAVIAWMPLPDRYDAERKEE